MESLCYSANKESEDASDVPTSLTESHREQMLKDLIQEPEKWDLAPKPASLWWTNTYDPEGKLDLSMGAKTRSQRFPFKEKLKILGFTIGSSREDARVP